MMKRLGAFAVTMLATTAAAAAEPPNRIVMWSFLGLPFAAPSMVAAIFGCTVTRVIIGQADRKSRWYVRVPIDLLTVGTTFFYVVEQSPASFHALGAGIFIGTLGATIIKIAEKWGGRAMAILLGETPPSPGSPPPAPPPPPVA